MTPLVIKAGFILAASAGYIIVNNSHRIALAGKSIVRKIKDKKRLKIEPEKINFC